MTADAETSMKMGKCLATALILVMWSAMAEAGGLHASSIYGNLPAKFNAAPVDCQSVITTLKSADRKDRQCETPPEEAACYGMWQEGRCGAIICSGSTSPQLSKMKKCGEVADKLSTMLKTFQGNDGTAIQHFSEDGKLLFTLGLLLPGTGYDDIKDVLSSTGI